jgi:uncharacterized small protein (TIGR04563 family)
MSGTDNRKQSLYFPEEMLNEIQREADRQDRSISWIVQQAWKVARGDIRKFPSVNDVLEMPRPTVAPTAVAAVTPTPLQKI